MLPWVSLHMATAGSTTADQGLRAPLGTLMALVGGVGAFLLDRVVGPALAGQVEEPVLRTFDSWGIGPRSFAALAGVLTLSIALFDIIKTRGVMPRSRTVMIAAFGGMFVPSLLLASFTPSHAMSTTIVLFAAAAAHVLVVLLVTSMRTEAQPLGHHIARVLVSLTSSVTLFALVTTRAARVLDVALLESLRDTARVVGQFAFVITVSVTALTLFPRARGLRNHVAQALGILGAALLLLCVYAARVVLRGDFVDVLYAAQHTLWTSEVAMLIAACLGATAFALALGATAVANPQARLVALGILFFTIAGFSPSTPLTLLWMVLGAALITRSGAPGADATTGTGTDATTETGTDAATETETHPL